MKNMSRRAAKEWNDLHTEIVLRFFSLILSISILERARKLIIIPIPPLSAPASHSLCVVLRHSTAKPLAVIASKNWICVRSEWARARRVTRMISVSGSVSRVQQIGFLYDVFYSHFSSRCTINATGSCVQLEASEREKLYFNYEFRKSLHSSLLDRLRSIRYTFLMFSTLTHFSTHFIYNIL